VSDDRDSASLTRVQEVSESPAPDGAEPFALPLDFSGTRLVQLMPEDGLPADPSTLAALLIEHSFGDAVVLLPSATAARRVMLETVRGHHRIAGRPKRRHLLVCAGPEPLPPEFAGDAEVSSVPEEIGVIRAEIGPRTAGILVAPVRLAGGIELLPGAFLAELRESADEYGLALVFDETDGGLGRTGMAFAHEWTGVTPDLMLLGEGAGVPLAALVLTSKVARGLPGSLPQVSPDALVGAAPVIGAALASGFEARVQSLGWLLEDRLASLRYRRPDLFTGLVGTGLMQGLVCAAPAEDLARRLAAEGLLVRAAGDVLAFLPPLNVGEAQIIAAADRLDEVVAAMEAAPAGSACVVT